MIRSQAAALGHAECIRIDFDPKEIAYRDLLTVFFASHDPTTLNRQGNDVGTQYRSAVFYTTSEQKAETEKFIAELTASDKGGKPIVTEIAPLDTSGRRRTIIKNTMSTIRISSIASSLLPKGGQGS